MPVEIFFCGEVVADMLEEKQGTGDFKLLLGGSQFHGARGAKKACLRDKLNFDIGFVGPMSRDTFGERFFAKLEEESLNTSGIKRVDRNTTLAIVSIRPGMENAFSFYGRDTAEQMTKIEDLPVNLGSKGAQRICCFGSISTVMEPARFAWLEFGRRRREDSLVCYDLNTRPSIAKDPVTYRDIVLEWAKVAHVVKASDADIGWAYPGMAMKDVAKIWLDAGASMAVFTKGPHGAEAHTRKATGSSQSLDLVTTNTVGAGDNFNAGLAIHFAKAGCFSPADIEKLTDAQVGQILHGANNTSAVHLLSIGAKLRADIPATKTGS